MSVTVAGVDGCRGGWLCVLRQVEQPFAGHIFFARTFEEILNHAASPAVIAIDIPIGLPERIAGPGRGCDIAVRKLLGKRRGSVFVVPARAAFAAPDYAGACAATLAASDPPRKISKQMFHLFPKIREVDAVITPALQARVFECHPEAAFHFMNGGEELQEPKKLRGRPNTPGLEYRQRLLEAQGYSRHFLCEATKHNFGAGADDVLDACACAWSAARIFKGEAIRFPAVPPLDQMGLRMEILA